MRRGLGCRVWSINKAGIVARGDVLEALFQGKLEPVSMQPQMQWLPGLF